ncbi:MAG: helix-turn-helix transcriptional regulator [Paracoccaceae bacterium]
MDDEFDTGGRPKALRQAAGLSQRQLAERAGVPHGQISMIETGRSRPRSPRSGASSAGSAPPCRRSSSPTRRRRRRCSSAPASSPT